MNKNIILMIVIRVISVLISFVSVRLMVRNVVSEEYGILLTLTSLVQWIGLMDFGLGNGLRNKLSVYLASGQLDKARESVSNCYVIFTLLMSAVALIFLVVTPHLSWAAILNTSNVDEAVMQKLAAIVFFSFCFVFVVNLVKMVLYSYQSPVLISVIELVAQFLCLVAIVVIIKVIGNSSVLLIGAANCIIPPLVVLISSVILFAGRLKEVAPSLKCVNLKSDVQMFALGLKFFVLQIITIVLYQANNILIAQITNPETVVIYNSSYKYLSVLLTVFVMVVSPLWSATTEAYVKGDILWIKTTVSRLRIVWFVIFLTGIVMVAVSPFVYDIWLGADKIIIPIATTFLVFASLAFQMLYKIFVSIINGIGKLWFQIICTSVIAVAFIFMAVGMGRAWGLNGVLLANIAAQFANYVWSRIQYSKIVSGKAAGLLNA